MRAFTVALILLIPISFYAAARSNSGGLAERVAELEAQVAVMEEILHYVHVETEEIKGVTGPHWIIEGANVHVRSGSGTTRDACDHLDPGFPNCESLTGLGNLIIGYNEQFGVGPPVPREIRTGSHNLVVGVNHSYSSFGGFVAGRTNAVTGWNTSVCGGANNEASGPFSSVSGGQENVASGVSSSVSGGHEREAPDDFDWVAGELFETN